MSAQDNNLNAVKARANSGDVPAQFVLGVLYDKSYGGNNWVESSTWYLRAAEQGNLDAQKKIAEHYDFGLGVPKDARLARGWWRNAAEQGDPDAETMLAIELEYSSTFGWERAVFWFVKAAAQGDAFAKKQLIKDSKDILHRSVSPILVFIGLWIVFIANQRKRRGNRDLT